MTFIPPNDVTIEDQMKALRKAIEAAERPESIVVIYAEGDPSDPEIAKEIERLVKEDKSKCGRMERISFGLPIRRVVDNIVEYEDLITSTLGRVTIYSVGGLIGAFEGEPDKLKESVRAWKLVAESSDSPFSEEMLELMLEHFEKYFSSTNPKPFPF